MPHPVDMPTFALTYIILPAIVLVAILTPLALSLREQNNNPPRDEDDDSPGGSAPHRTPPLRGDSSPVNVNSIEVDVPSRRENSPRKS